MVTFDSNHLSQPENDQAVELAHLAHQDPVGNRQSQHKEQIAEESQ